MPIKYSFTPRELINTYNRKVMTKVAEVFESSPPHLRGIVLEDCGSWLVQEAWQDRTGFYMTIRLAPLDKAREAVQEEGTILRVFAGYSGWSRGQLENELLRKTWVTHSPDEGMLDQKSIPDMWRDLICSHGAVFNFLTHTAQNLGNN